MYTYYDKSCEVNSEKSVNLDVITYDNTDSVNSNGESVKRSTHDLNVNASEDDVNASADDILSNSTKAAAAADATATELYNKDLAITKPGMVSNEGTNSFLIADNDYDDELFNTDLTNNYSNSNTNIHNAKKGKAPIDDNSNWNGVAAAVIADNDDINTTILIK